MDTIESEILDLELSDSLSIGPDLNMYFMLMKIHVSLRIHDMMLTMKKMHPINRQVGTTWYATFHY
jgi:hypothetical protein